MAGDLIAAQSEALGVLYRMLIGDPRAVDLVWISVITFGGHTEMLPLVPIDQFQPPTITTSGGRSFGEALQLLNNSLATDLRPGRYRLDARPFAFLFIGGSPSDNWQPEAKSLRTQRRGRWTPYVAGMGVGSNYDRNVLHACCDIVVPANSLTLDLLSYEWDEFMHDFDEPEVLLASDPELPAAGQAIPIYPTSDDNVR